MADDRRQAREWLEEMGFVLTDRAQTEEDDEAAFLSRLARLLREPGDQLKVKFKALRDQRAAA